MSTRSKQNQRSQKARMREALLLTEGNLTSLMGCGYPNAVAYAAWRNAIRRALGAMPLVEREPSKDLLLLDVLLGDGETNVPILNKRSGSVECICARCGIRHGLASTAGDF